MPDHDRTAHGSAGTSRAANAASTSRTTRRTVRSGVNCHAGKPRRAPPRYPEQPARADRLVQRLARDPEQQPRGGRVEAVRAEQVPTTDRAGHGSRGVPAELRHVRGTEPLEVLHDPAVIDPGQRGHESREHPV